MDKNFKIPVTWSLKSFRKAFKGESEWGVQAVVSQAPLAVLGRGGQRAGFHLAVHSSVLKTLLHSNFYKHPLIPHTFSKCHSPVSWCQHQTSTAGDTRSLRLKRKKDASKGFCSFSNISSSLGPAQTNIYSWTYIQVLFFKSKCHMESQAAATCTVLEQQLQGSPFISGWSCLVGAVGHLVPQRECEGWFLLSAGKNCSETTSCYITQSQTQGAAVWALIFAPLRLSASLG